MKHPQHLLVAGTLLLAATSILRAQSAPDAVCDSTIAAAKSGDVRSGIFLSIQAVTPGMDMEHAGRLTVEIGNWFTPPRPFKLSVFGGPSLVRGLRLLGSDTVSTVRSPTLTGVYRVTIPSRDSAMRVAVLRRSMVDGFDSAAVAAIQGASVVPGLFKSPSAELLAFNVTFTSDSEPAAQRLFAASFPRMPIKDAAPRPDNPAAQYPAADVDEGASPTVVLRFVVGRDGQVVPATVEAIRAAPTPFLRAALDALQVQRFRPAMVNGCPVSQQVDYPFAFLPPPTAIQVRRKD